MSIAGDFIPVPFACELRKLLEIGERALIPPSFNPSKSAYNLQGVIVLLQIQKDEFGAGSADRLYPSYRPLARLFSLTAAPAIPAIVKVSPSSNVSSFSRKSSSSRYF